MESAGMVSSFCCPILGTMPSAHPCPHRPSCSKSSRLPFHIFCRSYSDSTGRITLHSTFALDPFTSNPSRRFTRYRRVPGILVRMSEMLDPHV
ncbi:hypothetical protein B0O80DRAFT_252251 [Mortierella sp. GBAus27b]|nr:hypothetical protein B0O80DRAFT_252251 [Mortierella sp. GBAus27b]